jgi:hypothetical protein
MPQGRRFWSRSRDAAPAVIAAGPQRRAREARCRGSATGAFGTCSSTPSYDFGLATGHPSVEGLMGGRFTRLSAGPRSRWNVALADVRFEAHYGLKSDLAPSPKTFTGAEVGLFDYLIGASQRRRQFKAEGFCRLEVMDEVEFGRLFNWSVGRLRAS